MVLQAADVCYAKVHISAAGVVHSLTHFGPRDQLRFAAVSRGGCMAACGMPKPNPVRAGPGSPV
jgi:hypothetical protein